MKTLSFYNTSEIDQLASPELSRNYSMNSSALDFFTDFLETTPLVIDSTLSVVEAKRLMQKSHVRMMFVVDANEQFVGIISADDLIDRRLVQKVSEGLNRNEITLTEMMTAKLELKALDYSEVAGSNIGDVIAALKNNGHRHCLVIDRNSHKIRGIFSASDISRKLKLPIDIENQSSFYNIYMNLSHSPAKVMQL